MSFTKDEANILKTLNKLKTKYPEIYSTKLNSVSDKIDILLSKKLSDKNSFYLLSTKLTILNFLNN